jgi:hypothetical protein
MVQQEWDPLYFKGNGNGLFTRKDLEKTILPLIISLTGSFSFPLKWRGSFSGANKGGRINLFPRNSNLEFVVNCI